MSDEHTEQCYRSRTPLRTFDLNQSGCGRADSLPGKTEKAFKLFTVWIFQYDYITNDHQKVTQQNNTHKQKQTKNKKSLNK